MNLRAFLGRSVMIQLRAPWLYVAADTAGMPSMAMTVPKGAKDPVPLSMVFVQGKIVGFKPPPETESGQEIVFEYFDDTSGRKVIVDFNEEMIFSVSTLLEKPLVLA